MRQHPAIPYPQARKTGMGMLLLLFFLMLLSGMAGAREPASHTLTFTNRSEARVTKVVLAPYGLIQVHTDTSLAPGEKIDISRPECKKMKMEVVHSKGRYTFPFTDFSHEKNTALSLMVRKDSIPILRYDGRKRADITGDNSDWRFSQILGAIPFGVGVTTLAEAQALGAKADKNRKELETTLLWGSRNWEVAMNFSGADPESRLTRLEMTAKGAHGKTPSDVHEALMARGYVYYSMVLGKSPKEIYVTVPLARALERASMNKRSLATVLASHPAEVVVESSPGKKVWVVTMTQAPQFVTGQ